MSDPIYTPTNCTDPGYQLDWSYSIFWHQRPADCWWVDELKRLNEPDHIRILQHQFQEPNVSQFLISTTPSVPPILVAQRVKGRLQHLLHDKVSKPFRRNYSLRSIGSTRREKLEQYLAIQLNHHPMADPRVEQRFEKYQVFRPEVDLSQPRKTSHALYWYNLHIVIVNDERHREIRDETLTGLQNMILKASAAKAHRLSQAAIVPDHIHLTVGCSLEESPEQVVLGYMNNLAYTSGMKPVFRFSYFVGTFSEYDLGVIPRVSAESPLPPSKLGGEQTNLRAESSLPPSKLGGEQTSTFPVDKSNSLIAMIMPNPIATDPTMKRIVPLASIPG